MSKICAKEVVFFDEDNEEIDWYYPVVDEPTIEGEMLIIRHNNGHTYEVDLNTFPHYEWREREGV